jgi:hypothetical protein
MREGWYDDTQIWLPPNPACLSFSYGATISHSLMFQYRLVEEERGRMCSSDAKDRHVFRPSFQQLGKYTLTLSTPGRILRNCY